MLAKLSPRSILLIIVSAIFGRAATALSQVIAAIYLSPTDFGIYATASGFMLVTTALRAGGSGNHFPTMTIEEFHRDGPRIFWYSMRFVLFGLITSAIVAWPVSLWVSANQDYSPRLLVLTMAALAGNFILFNVACYPRYFMLAHGRIKELSAIESVMGAGKLLSTWLLASAGEGPLALALAIFFSEAIETVWAWARARVPLRFDAPHAGWFWQTLRDMIGPLSLALLAAVGGPTDSLIGSWVLPVSALGVYYFTTQLASQPAILAGSSIRSLFSIAAATSRGHAVKEAESLRLVFNGSMVFIPLITMFIPAIFEPVERAIWSGKWAMGVWPVRIFSIAMIYPTALQLLSAPVAGLRQWRLAIRIDLVRSVPKLLAALLALLVLPFVASDPAESINVFTILVSVFMAGAATWELFRIMQSARMTRATALYELYSTPLAAILSAFAAAGLSRSLVEPLAPHLDVRIGALAEAGLAGAVYICLSFVLLRFGYTQTLERLIEALPEFLRASARRMLFLGA